MSAKTTLDRRETTVLDLAVTGGTRTEEIPSAAWAARVKFTDILVRNGFRWQDAFVEAFPERVEGREPETVKNMAKKYRQMVLPYVQEYFLEVKEALKSRLVAEAEKSLDKLVDLRDNAVKSGGKDGELLPDNQVQIKAAEDLLEYGGMVSKKVEVMGERDYADTMRKYYDVEGSVEPQENKIQ